MEFQIHLEMNLAENTLPSICRKTRYFYMDLASWRYSALSELVARHKKYEELKIFSGGNGLITTDCPPECKPSTKCWQMMIQPLHR
jgi:hypothetical protein